MAKLIMLIGVPGSGKTTFARKMSSELGYKIISSDVIRQTFPGIEENKVFPTVYKMCIEELKNNRNVILDATNITPKVRKRAWDALDSYEVKYEKVAYYFDTPQDICVSRVEKRNLDKNELYLPVDVIVSYYQNIVKPTCDEGFSEIVIIKNNE